MRSRLKELQAAVAHCDFHPARKKARTPVKEAFGFKRDEPADDFMTKAIATLTPQDAIDSRQGNPRTYTYDRREGDRTTQLEEYVFVDAERRAWYVKLLVTKPKPPDCESLVHCTIRSFHPLEHTARTKDKRDFNPWNTTK